MVNNQVRVKTVDKKEIHIESNQRLDGMPRRQALIKSMDGQFLECLMDGADPDYTFEDWVFMLEVATAITENYERDYSGQ